MSWRRADSLITLEIGLNEPPSPALLEEAIARATAQGIRFFTLSDAGDTLEARFSLYELVREGVVDDPSNDGTFMPFDDFSQNLFEPYYWRWANSQFLAAHSRTWVGLVNLQVREDGYGEFGVTVVRRAYRGKGIARALKLMALSHAHGLGLTCLRTRSDTRNAAILHLNRALGFVENPDC